MLTYLKTAIFTVAILILGLIGYILFTFDSHYESQIALDAFLKGENAKAEEIVKRIPLGKADYHLYLAYLSRAKHQMALSDEHLALAAQEAGPLAFEVALNQAYQGYLSGDRQALQRGLSAAAGLDPDSSWIAFFQSLDRNEPQPLEDNFYLSPWMKKSFGFTFTPFWNMLQKTRSEISQGQTLQARQRLEQITHADATEAADIQLLLGLSYLKEAETVPPLASTPYYRLAFGYFGRVPLQSQRFAYERELLLRKISEQIALQIEHGRYQELAFYSSMLESLNAPPEIYLGIRQSAIKSILEVIPIDTDELTLTLPQIDIWLKVEQDAKARHGFALALMALAEQLWIEQTEKALQLSLTAASIPALSEQKALQKKVESYLQNAPKPAKKEPSSYLTQLALKNYESYRHALSSPLDPRLFLEVGDTCYSLGQPCEGRIALLRAIELARPYSQEYLKTILPLIAEIEMGLGLEVEAWRHLAEYYRMFPKDMEGRARYARLSMDLQRYDLAQKEWQTLEEAGRLSDDDWVDYIASLVRAGHAERAKSKAVTGSFNPTHQLEIARWMLIAGDPGFIQPSHLPDARAQIAQLALYRAQGDFAQAKTLASSAKEQLSRSPQGLLALAELQNDLSNRKGAMQLAQQAFLLDPDNRSIKAFLEPFQTLPEIESRLEQIIGQLLFFPKSPTLQLKQAQALIDLQIAQSGNSSAIRQANLILDGLLQSNYDLPSLHYLKGEAALLSDRPEESREAFLKAASLDPSYTQACHYLGIVCESLHKPDEALQALRQAIKFKPHDADIWIELALFNVRLGLDKDALQSWQQVVKFQPRNAMAYYQIARLNCSLQDLDGACGALEKALEINSQNAKALKLLLILESLK